MAAGMLGYNRQICCRFIYYNKIKGINSVFYKLQPGYMLRGWEKAAWALVHWPENKVQHLPPEVFQVLLLCDGETNLSVEELQQTTIDILKKCTDRGWIEACENPQRMAAEQYYRYFKNRYVRSVMWSITGRCNYRCRHCYMDAPDGALGELSTEQALNLIDQMAECGILRVNITGGEPFVRRDFWQLIDRILSHKMTVDSVYTNGWLLNESVLHGFEDRGMKPEISISFDGVGWHDWMRGISGAEEAAMRALRLCQKHNFDTTVEMCVHRGNMDVISKTIEAMRSLAVRKIKIGSVSMTDLWRQHSEGNALTDDEYIEAMMRYIPEYYRAGCPMNVILGGVIGLNTDGSYRLTAGDSEVKQDSYLCGSARWGCYITPEGRLLPCLPMTSSPQEIQNLFPLVRDIGLQKGLSDSFYMQFVNRRVKDLLAVNKECAECKYNLMCGGGCRASALLSGEHDLMGCDRSMCNLLKNGYEERIRKVAEEARTAYELCKAEPRA